MLGREKQSGWIQEGGKDEEESSSRDEDALAGMPMELGGKQVIFSHNLILVIS